MDQVNICLIGGGPRALVTLNALRRHILEFGNPDVQFVIAIVDPNTHGSGCHDPNQPYHLYTNTLASQLTAFYPAPAGEEASNWLTGPSFTEWARMTGIENMSGQFDQSLDGTPLRLVSELDYLPRSLLGQYLAWAFRRLRASFPDRVTVRPYHAMALDVQQDGDARFTVQLSNGGSLTADYVFVSTGHSTNQPSPFAQVLGSFAEAGASHNPDLLFLPQCYPTTQLERISPDARVAIQGLGLTAWDAIAELTEGRGGRYENQGGKVVYRPSGSEPFITLFSRKGLPFAARGINQKGLTGRHQARFFTPQAVETIRAEKLARTGNRQLDFETEILPLLLREMAFAYRQAKLGRPIEALDFASTAEEMAALQREFEPFGEHVFGSLDEFRNAFLHHVRADLAEAEKGNLGSPIKSATDVIRDCRAAICAAVEYRGLTPDSERWFRQELVPTMNRISFGPPLFRNHQLLALFHAGVVDLAAGPANKIKLDKTHWRYVIETDFARTPSRVEADVLIIARLDPFVPEADANPLTAALLRNGLVRPLQNGSFRPGGYDVTPDFQPVGRNGSPTRNIWIMGYPTEGATFYTHAIPRAGLASPQYAAADTCVSQMFADLAAYRPAKPTKLVQMTT